MSQNCGPLDSDISLTNFLSPNAEKRQVAILTVRGHAPYLQDLTTLHPDPSVHGFKHSHPCYELVYVPRYAIVDPVRPRKKSSKENMEGHPTKRRSNDEVSKSIPSL